jgi:16S rRNA processing protein RimM
VSGVTDQPNEVALGRVMSSFGVRGEVRVFLFNRETDFFSREREVTLVSKTGERRRVRIRMRSGSGKRVIGRLDGVDDKESADALHDWEIWVEKDCLPDLEEGAFYHHELLGLPVETESGRPLGALAEVHAAGGVDSWVIRSGTEECYVAALRENVIQVLPGDRIIVADHVGETV